MGSTLIAASELGKRGCSRLSSSASFLPNPYQKQTRMAHHCFVSYPLMKIKMPGLGDGMQARQRKKPTRAKNCVRSGYPLQVYHGREALSSVIILALPAKLSRTREALRSYFSAAPLASFSTEDAERRFRISCSPERNYRRVPVRLT